MAATPNLVKTNWDTNRSYSQDIPTAVADSHSAYIIFDRKYITYRKRLLGTEWRMEITQTIHRKIRILSMSVIGDFNKVYVPSIGSLFLKNEIIEVKGRTIKQDGTILTIDTADVRETTLPANHPFLGGFQGKVQLFALQGVGIGDEVEYYYTIQNDYPDNTESYQNFGSYDFSVPYPCSEISFTVSTNKEFFFKSFPVNIDAGMAEVHAVTHDAKSYSISVKDLKPVPDERFALNYQGQKMILYHIYRFNSNAIDATWEEATNEKLSKYKGSQYLPYARVPMITALKNVTTHKTLKRQVEAIAELFNKPFLEKKETVGVGAYPDVDRYDLSAINQLANAIGAKANFWYVTSRRNGEMKENIPSLNQFTDVIVEIYKPGGVSYYLNLFRPLDKLDEVSYNYHNTKALKLSVGDKNRIVSEFSVFTVKPLKSLSSAARNYDIMIRFGDETSISVKESTRYSGYLMSRHKEDIYKSVKYNDYTEWRDNMHLNLNNRLEDANILSLIPTRFYPPIDTAIGWDIEYNYSRILPQVNLWSFNLAELTGYSTSFYMHCDKRKKDAYLGAPYYLNFNYKLKVSDGTLMLNDLLNQHMENELGYLRSEVKAISLYEIIVDIQYSITSDFCPSSDWCKYTALENAFDKVLQQTLLISAKH